MFIQTRLKLYGILINHIIIYYLYIIIGKFNREKFHRVLIHTVILNRAKKHFEIFDSYLYYLKKNLGSFYYLKINFERIYLIFTLTINH